MIKTMKYTQFTNDELSIIRECLSNWRMEDLGLEEQVDKLEKEVAEELEERYGITHSTKVTNGLSTKDRNGSP